MQSLMTISIPLKYANTTLTNMNSLITVSSPICMISAIRFQEAHLQDSFDTATGSVDVKEFTEDGVIHVYSNETGKDVAQIPLTKLSELEKEVKDFVEYKLSTYKVANPTKRSDLVPKSIYAFDIPDEIARVKRYKEYAEYCLKQLEQMQKEG